jgi:hypothetical protein
MVLRVVHDHNLLLETYVLARNEMTVMYTECFAIDSGPKCTIVADRLHGMGVEISGFMVRAMALYMMQDITAGQSMCRECVRVSSEHVHITIGVKSF